MGSIKIRSWVLGWGLGFEWVALIFFRPSSSNCLGFFGPLIFPNKTLCTLILIRSNFLIFWTGRRLGERWGWGKFRNLCWYAFLLQLEIYLQFLLSSLLIVSLAFRFWTTVCSSECWKCCKCLQKNETAL